MDEERDIAKNLAEAFRELKDIIDGKSVGIPWEKFESDVQQWIQEAKEEEILRGKQAI